MGNNLGASIVTNLTKDMFAVIMIPIIAHIRIIIAVQFVALFVGMVSEQVQNNAIMVAKVDGLLTVDRLKLVTHVLALLEKSQCAQLIVVTVLRLETNNVIMVIKMDALIVWLILGTLVQTPLEKSQCVLLLVVIK